MRKQVEIEKSIRDSLPIIFGKSESIDRGTFLEKYNEFVDYAIAVSQPFLTAETIRYQSILISTSLIFVSVSLFQIDKFKIVESEVSVNHRFLVIYTIFIAAITLIFLSKAHFDHQREKLVRSRYPTSYKELQNLLFIGQEKKRIQEYFWQEVSNVIGHATNTYFDARWEALNSSPINKFTSKELINLDQEDLCKISELATEIATQDKHLAALTKELAEDTARFMDKAKTILNARSQTQDVVDNQPSYNDLTIEIEEAYDECLGNWIEAQKAMGDKHLSLKKKEMTDDPDLHKAKGVLVVLEQIEKIRNKYALLEISAPVVFAFGAILYVVWRQ